MEKKMIKCKVCPIGCKLTILKNNSNPHGYTVKGNSCNRGLEFGIKEMVEPSRVVTGRVMLKNGKMKRLPVKTTAPVPKDKVDEVMLILNNTEAIAPIKRGDVIIKNILNLGIDVIAARKINALKN